MTTPGPQRPHAPRVDRPTGGAGAPGADAADATFRAAVAGALADDVSRVLAEDDASAAASAHRHLAARVRTLVAAAGAVPLPGRDPADLLARALPLVGHLRDRQNPSGLFAGGDNVDSPPDTAFSANDLADAVAMIDRRWPSREATAPVDPSRAAAARLRAATTEVLSAATPALLAGGVHTPNHRWELSAALGRLLRLRPPPELADRLADRIGQWLAEGVDVDADGLYSERSANYAAAVSNPSLLLLAAVLGREDLRAVVERNLEATLDLLLPDGSVETVHSRRQDQRTTTFPLAALLLPLRSVAVATGRGDLAWAAGVALAQGLHAAGTHDGLEGGAAATALVLDPHVARPLPAPRPPAPARRRAFGCGLVVDHRPRAATVVAASGDHARHGRVRSGLASSPTFLRLHAGRAVLDSVRLSRTFFGLGPFRSGDLQVADDAGACTLHEVVSAAYYQPLPPPLRHPSGEYAVTDDGRFSAAMDFPARPRDEVRLTTTVEVLLTPDGADLLVEVDCAPDGPAVDWVLELALRPGGRLDGARALPPERHPGGRDQERWLLAAAGGARATWSVGDDALVVEVLEAGDGRGGPLLPAAEPPRYDPGEDHRSLGGTDAAPGELLLLAGRTPSSLRLRLSSKPSRPAGEGGDGVGQVPGP